jgi:excisionase family DNA binding protein
VTQAIVARHLEPATPPENGSIASEVITDEPLMDVKAVAILLQCSKGCVRNMARAGILPFRKIGVVGTHYRFRKSDIAAWLNGPERGKA